MKITLKEIIEVNQQFGGSLISDSSLSFAEAYGKQNRSIYMQAAVWARAIVVDHPFSDANKRTALYAIAKHVEVKDPVAMARVISRIAAKNIIDLKKIVEMLKYANR
jgi:prophage maintenance system killer protein